MDEAGVCGGRKEKKMFYWPPLRFFQFLFFESSATGEVGTVWVPLSLGEGGLLCCSVGGACFAALGSGGCGTLLKLHLQLLH